MAGCDGTGPKDDDTQGRLPESMEPGLEQYLPIYYVRGQPASAVPPLLAECLVGGQAPDSARIRFADLRGELHEDWVSLMAGVIVESGDTVLMVQPGNATRPIVVGVAARPNLAKAEKTAAHLRLDPGEHLRVESSSGSGLLEVFEGPIGPVVRLLDRDMVVETPGNLKISAERLELESRRGDATVHASGDVVVSGKFVRIN
jgi:hypothetical protein